MLKILKDCNLNLDDTYDWSIPKIDVLKFINMKI